ncbi:MAG: tetratricopeptide repeat protein [Xanthomonadales bacterium]|nr:tetratricopeptide repeat protein [Xanthomonadales bacterium]
MSAVFWLCGCATQQLVNSQIPPLRVNEPVAQVADVDVVAVSPEMDAFLEQYILPYNSIHTRMTLLMDAVSGNGVLDFDYDDGFTLTSVDAFKTHAGNCIGFANMLVALARKSGIKASYQEVLRRPEWSTREDTVLLVKHINVILEGAGYTYVMDVSGIRISPAARRQVISDSYAKALYFNNLGAEALIRNDLPTAYAYMSRAIETEPNLTDSWINIGVVLSRNGQLADAEAVLKKALQIDGNEYAALSNLYEIYISQENFEAAAALESRVERYRQRNPYYLMQLSEEALMQGDAEEALRLIQRAIKKKDNDHQLYFALARTQYVAGQVNAAQASLSRARELAPVHMDKFYQRPLDELVAEAQLQSQSG